MSHRDEYKEAAELATIEDLKRVDELKAKQARLEKWNAVLFDGLHSVRAHLARGKTDEAYAIASFAMNEYMTSCGIHHAMSAVLSERVRQFEKWGEQDHDVTTWNAILGEEAGEFAEACLDVKFSGKPLDGNLRTEAVQVAAVALQIVEWIDSKTRTEDAGD